jgi:hypothetical protein
MRRKFPKKSLHSPSFIMPAEVSLSNEGAVNLITAINIQEMLLQKDHASHILYQNNPDLFNGLKGLIQIDSVSLKRKEVTRRKEQVNRLGTKIGEAPIPSHATETIVYSSFRGLNLIPKTRFVLDNGESHVISKEKLKKSPDGVISYGKTLSIDDLSSAFEHSNIRQVRLLDDSKIIFLTFRDFSASQEGGSKYKYGLEINFTAKTTEFLRKTIGEIETIANKLSLFHKAASMPGAYNYKEKVWRKDFLDFMINSNKEKSTAKDALWVKAPKHYYIGLSLLKKSRGIPRRRAEEERRKFRNMAKLLNPIKANPENYLKACKMFEKLILKIKKTYGLNLSPEDNLSLQTSSVGGIKAKNGIAKSKHTIEKFFNDTVDVRQTRRFGYEFIEIKKTSGFPVVSIQEYKRRVVKERKKFFKGTPSNNKKFAKNLSSVEQKDLVDLSSASTYFTPARVVFGNQKKSLLEPNEKVFDNEFFTQFSLAKSSKSKDHKFNSNFDLSPDSNLSKSSATFGFTITPSLVSNVEREVNEEDNFNSIQEYLGDNSYLSELVTPSLKMIIPTFSKMEKDDSKKVMANFAELRRSPRSARKVSLKNFDLNDKKGQPTSYIGKGAKKGKLKNLPISVKALFIDSENDRSVRHSFAGGGFDPLSNIQTRESIKQNFLNIKKLVFLSGFEKSKNGVPDLNYPIWKAMGDVYKESDASVVKKNRLCKLLTFEDHELGIIKDDNEAPTYDSLFVLRGKNNAV